jgi:pilus assembly protein CpaE
MEWTSGLKGLAGKNGESARAIRAGYVNGAVTQEQVTAIAALFPNVVFVSLGESVPDNPTELDIIFAEVDAAKPERLEQAVKLCKLNPTRPQVVIVLRNAELSNTRALLQSGAADVLPAPVSNAELALSLERILARGIAIREPARRPGQMVAILKAGGGVGATSLGVQATVLAAGKTGDPGRVCFADLDLQFGAAALYFDIDEALTVSDCLAVGEFLSDTQFATALTAHKSGVRVLAAPREVTSLDAMNPQLAEALLNGLKRDFALSIVDLPSAWTPWTDRALHMADRIILVTKLSVPHVHLVRRQLNVLGMQKLDGVPLTLVCNAASSEQQSMLSIKTAERAIGRSFDMVMPEDVRIMGTAANQGLTLSEVRRGTKLEKMIESLADAMAANALTGAASLRMR